MAFALWIIENYTIDFSPLLLTKKVNFCFNTNCQILKAILLSEVEFYSFGQFLKVFDMIRFCLGKGREGKRRWGNLSPLFPLVRESSIKRISSGVVVNLIKRTTSTTMETQSFMRNFLPCSLVAGGERSFGSRGLRAAAGSFNLDFQRLALDEGPRLGCWSRSGFPDPLSCIWERKRALETLIVNQFSVQEGIRVFFSPH